MTFPDYSLTPEEVGDLEVVGHNGAINVDLYAYLQQQLIEAQITFMRALQEEDREVVDSFLDGWETWCHKIEQNYPHLAVRLRIAMKIFRVIFAFDPQEAEHYLPHGLMLRDTWQPLIEAVAFSLRNCIKMPYLIGSLSLQIRDAFIKRHLN